MVVGQRAAHDDLAPDERLGGEPHGRLSRPRRSSVPPTSRLLERGLERSRRADRVNDQVEAPLVIVQGCGEWRPAGSAMCDALRVDVANVDVDAPIEEGKRHEQSLGTDSDHQGRRGERCAECGAARPSTTAIGSTQTRSVGETPSNRPREAAGTTSRSASAPGGSCRRTAVPRRPRSSPRRHWAQAKQATLGSTTTVSPMRPGSTPSPDRDDRAERLVAHDPRIGTARSSGR